MKILNNIVGELNWIWNLDLIEFISNYLIKLKYIEWILNFNEFKFNWREMRFKLMQKIVKICLWLWSWKK
jgi:hypothetical protein